MLGQAPGRLVERGNTQAGTGEGYLGEMVAEPEPGAGSLEWWRSGWLGGLERLGGQRAGLEAETGGWVMGG